MDSYTYQMQVVSNDLAQPALRNDIGYTSLVRAPYESSSRHLKEFFFIEYGRV